MTLDRGGTAKTPAELRIRADGLPVDAGNADKRKVLSMSDTPQDDHSGYIDLSAPQTMLDESDCRGDRRALLFLSSERHYFEPYLARWHIPTPTEIRNVAKLVGIRPSWRLGQKLHVAIAMAVSEGLAVSVKETFPAKIEYRTLRMMEDFVKSPTEALSHLEKHGNLAVGLFSVLDKELGPWPQNDLIELLRWLSRAQDIAKATAAQMSGSFAGRPPDIVRQEIAAFCVMLMDYSDGNMRIPDNRTLDEDPSAERAQTPLMNLARLLIGMVVDRGTKVINAQRSLPTNNSFHLPDADFRKVKSCWSKFAELARLETNQARRLANSLSNARKLLDEGKDPAPNGALGSLRRAIAGLIQGV